MGYLKLNLSFYVDNFNHVVPIIERSTLNEERISSSTHTIVQLISQHKHTTPRIQIDFNAERHKKTFEAQFVVNALPNKHMHNIKSANHER